MVGLGRGVEREINDFVLARGAESLVPWYEIVPTGGRGQLVRITYKFAGRGGEVKRALKHFSLDMILAIGCRVRPRGT